MLPIILAINDEGDRNFVGDIYSRYGKQMYIIAFDILKKKENAEDCVHDVIKIIINNIERFRSADYEYLINLIAKCTRNTAINIYNKEKRYLLCVQDSHTEECEKKSLSMILKNFDNILINEEKQETPLGAHFRA